VIEDNAQAIGASYKGRPTGSLSDVACISFYPTKNLGACGDAGMLVTNSDTIAERLRALRAHGMRKRYYHDELGINSRLDEIQAAILLSKLPYLQDWTHRRQEIAQLYDKALKDCPGIVTPTILDPNLKAGVTTHVWHQYTIQILSSEISNSASDSTRDTVMSELFKRGIGSMCYYPVPLHLQKAFAYLGYHPGDFPIAEQLSKQVLSLPMYPELTEAQANSVALALKEISQNLASPHNLQSQIKAQAILAG
jgi:dTDP-4-amino-4,6-dideoxygalactose transaminase